MTEERKIRGRGIDHIRLTSHAIEMPFNAPKINWFAEQPSERGPVIGTISDKQQRNCIGSHGGNLHYRGLEIIPISNRGSLSG